METARLRPAVLRLEPSGDNIVRRGSRRSITIAAAGLALALAATGCGGSDKKASDTTGTTEASKPVGKPTPGGELSMAIESESAGGYCLPTAQLASAGILVANQVYDGLFAYNAKHEPVPYLAETASWNDAHTALTLKLRSGIKFHNGAPLDSAIVKLNLDVLRGDVSYLEDQTGLPLQARLDAVAGAHAEVVAALNPVEGERMQRALLEEVAGMQQELAVAHAQVSTVGERETKSVVKSNCAGACAV